MPENFSLGECWLKLSVGLILYYIYAYLSLEELDLDLAGWVAEAWAELRPNSAKLELGYVDGWKL